MKRDSSSRKDGGIGRNPLLPHTTKMRITTNLKSINNQKCQKIKVHGTPTTKELKKKKPEQADSNISGTMREANPREQQIKNSKAGRW